MNNKHGGARRGSGRKGHQPTDAIRSQVKAFAAVGVTQAQLCKVIGIGDDAFRKYYQDDFDTAKIQAVANVAGSLYKRATEGKDLAAAIFYLKAQGGWRETPVVEQAGILNIHIHV